MEKTSTMTSITGLTQQELKQKFKITYIDDDGDIILIDSIMVLKSCTIQEIIERQSIDSALFSIYIGEPRYGNNGLLENTKIEPQYFDYTIENLNLWHPSNYLHLIICGNF